MILSNKIISISSIIKDALSDNKNKKIRVNKICSLLETFDLANASSPGKYPVSLHVQSEMTMKIYSSASGEFKIHQIDSSVGRQILKILKTSESDLPDTLIYHSSSFEGKVVEKIHPILKNSMSSFIDSLFELMSSDAESIPKQFLA